MRELRSNCEWCDCDLPPDSPDARICSDECTYCATCVDTVLHNVCATCGGGFSPHPVRPQGAHRAGLTLGLGHQPAAKSRTHSRWPRDQVEAVSQALRDIPPQRR